MECPACGRVQKNESAVECEDCGVPFARWKAMEFEDLAKGALKIEEPSEKKLEAVITPGKAVLDVSSRDVMAFRVDSQVRTLGAVLIFFVEPAVMLAMRLVKQATLSPYLVICVICTMVGIGLGLVAHKRGYSEILTAGGAGFLAGILKFSILYLITQGLFMEKLRVSLPLFAFYTFFSLLGGVAAWALRRFAKVELD